MSYFKDVFEAQSKDRQIIGGFLSDLVEAGVIPRETTRYGFTIHVADEINNMMRQATEEQVSKAVELARKRICNAGKP